MSTASPEPPAPEAPRRCEGFGCTARADIRYDQTSKAWLCAPCWAKVDPAKFGTPRR